MIFLKSLLNIDIYSHKNSNRNCKIAREVYKSCIICMQQYVKDPRLKSINITRVCMSKDLKHAKIFFLFIKDASNEPSFRLSKLLNRNSGLFRSLIAKRILIRVIPHLRFYYDEEAERDQNLWNLLDNLKHS